MKTIVFGVGFILAFTVGVGFLPLLPEPVNHVVGGLATMFLVGMLFRHKLRKGFSHGRLSSGHQLKLRGDGSRVTVATIAFGVGFILAFTVGVRFMPLLPEPVKHVVAGLAGMFIVGMVFRLANRLARADQSPSP